MAGPIRTGSLITTLPEAETTKTPSELGFVEPDADSIRVARLPSVAGPPPLTFVTEVPRSIRVELRIPPRVVATIIALLTLVAVIAASFQAAGQRAHKPTVILTPAQRHLLAAERARAAAIAKAKRDRGTDAELNDTIPVVTPAPGG